MQQNKRHAINARERLVNALNAAGYLDDDGSLKRWTGGKVAKAAGTSYQSVYRWMRALELGQEPKINERILSAIERNVGLTSSKSKWRRPNSDVGRFDTAQVPPGATGYFIVWGPSARDADGNDLYLQTAVYDITDANKPLNKHILRWAVANAPLIEDGLKIDTDRPVRARR